MLWKILMRRERSSPQGTPQAEMTHPCTVRRFGERTRRLSCGLSDQPLVSGQRSVFVQRGNELSSYHVARRRIPRILQRIDLGEGLTGGAVTPQHVSR